MDTASLQHIFEIALPLFLIMDPVGNAALCIAMLGGETPRRQRIILLREALIALGFVALFQFIGEGLLAMLEIHQSTLRVAGGVILFIISMKLVFPPASGEQPVAMERDPFIVPIAVPLIAGPSLLAAVMVYAHREPSQATVFAGVLAAWVPTAAILMSAPKLTKILGERGMRAAERLMGLILILLSVQMLEDGVRLFLSRLD